MKRALPYAASAFLIAWLILTALFTVALNDELYDLFQRLSGVTLENSGLTDVERMSLNRDVAMYLAGRAQEISGASERALSHMADVRGLFTIARWAMYACFALAACFLAFAWKHARDGLLRAYRVCALIYAGLALALALACGIDFDSAFKAFHRLAFSNDLWILDPAQDALIRVLPGAFFARAAAAVAIIACLEVAFAGFVIYLAKKGTGRLRAE